MSTRRGKAILASLLAFAVIAHAEPAKVTHIDPPKRMLFVGNSFTYFNDGVPLHVKQLAAAADSDKAALYDYRMVTISGAWLRELEPMLTASLKGAKWDVVVLQGQSREPSDTKDVESFRATVRSFDKAIRDSGAKTVLYMTWPYKDTPAMTQPLADGYVAIANEVNALVVPVGIAFDKSSRENPSINLYYVDGKHPSAEGTYLAACVFYSAFYAKSAEGNSYRSTLDPKQALILQKSAWETVRAFYNW